MNFLPADTFRPRSRAWARSKEKHIMSRLVATVFTAITLLGAAATLSACNTTAGVGEDVSSAGHAVTNAADTAKH
jgi:predicted small secreted protein